MFDGITCKGWKGLEVGVPLRERVVERVAAGHLIDSDGDNDDVFWGFGDVGVPFELYAAAEGD